MKIYLAGDSIVQNYEKEEFIAGWGQFLPFFIKDGVEVVNDAKGGRSSRLFINEGRFDNIEKNISAGDYLLIEFCHNDDASKEYKTMFNRLTPLGEPDSDGRFPIIPGEAMPKDYIPLEYIDALRKDENVKDKQAVLDSVYKILESYPHDTYYPYSADGSKGTYLWFLKQFVDMAREKGAVPVFVTAPARTVYDANGNIKDGAGLHGGNNFAYIRAMKQLGEEAKVPVIDLFAYSCGLYKQIGKEKIHWITSIKKGCNKGIWPDDFNSEMQKKETVSENTHFNKYGAMLITQGLVKLIKESDSSQLDGLKGMLKNPDGIDIEKYVKKPLVFEEF
jgi:carbohydrate esterase family 12 protein